MRGEPEDFVGFVAARQDRLLRMAWLLTGDWHLAEDLVQAALAKVWPHWPRIRDGEPDAYVRRVLVTTWSGWRRRRWRGETPTDLLPDRADGADRLAAWELHADLIAALRTLPPGRRAVVVLRYFEDLSEAETARLLGCSVGAVKSQTSRALVALRATVDGVGSALTKEET